MSVVVIRYENSSGGPSRITFVVYIWLARSTIAAGTRSVRARELSGKGEIQGDQQGRTPGENPIQQWGGWASQQRRTDFSNRTL
jgi:hypothetical protein